MRAALYGTRAELELSDLNRTKGTQYTALEVDASC
jgi:hypothetical protein